MISWLAVTHLHYNVSIRSPNMSRKNPYFSKSGGCKSAPPSLSVVVLAVPLEIPLERLLLRKIDTAF